MILTLLGTGAADNDWKNYPKGTFGSTTTLIDTACLIDAGPSTLRGFHDAGADPARLTDIVFTHSHGDHLSNANLRELVALRAPNAAPLSVWGSPQVLQSIADDIPLQRHPVEVGDDFTAAGFAFTTLAANHETNNHGEVAHHYLIRTPDNAIRVLYALDGAWMIARTLELLKNRLAGAPLSAILWDATSARSRFNWRFASHNDLFMIDEMRTALLGMKLIDEHTLHVFDHLAHYGLPKTETARNRLAERHHGLFAHDGMTLSL